jgi:hypothetical protein
MKRITAKKFKTRRPAILDRLGPGGIVIATKGKSVATLMKAQSVSAALIGCVHGKIAVTGQIFSMRVE